jgi:hypothetical protein
LPGRSGGIISTSFGFHFGCRSLTKLEAAPTSHHEAIAGFSNPLFGGLAVPGAISTFNSALTQLRHPENRHREIDL